MFDSKSDCQFTTTHILVPVSLMAFTMMLLFAFQGTQIMRDRDALHEAKGQQEKAFVDSQRVQEQVKALLVGTQQLAEKGNKNAQEISARLKQAGIIQTPAAAPAEKAASPAPVPAASETPERGPVKP